MMKQCIYATALGIILAIGVVGCSHSNSGKRAHGNHVMVASISSDGRYVITTNLNRHAYLWDLKQHTQKQLPTYPVNIFSAYFVKHSHHFMIQNDASNEVLVKNIAGTTVKHFNPKVATRGEVITHDLSTWLGSDKFFQLYRYHHGKTQQFFYYWCGPNYKDEKKPPKGMPYGCSSAMGSGGKTFSLSLNANENYLTTSDGGGRLYIWSTQGKLIKKIKKNNSETFNTISPNGHYLVTGDVSKVGIIYDLNKHQLVYDQNYAIETPKKDTIKPYFKGPYNQNSIGEITGLNFISHENYLVSFKGHDAPFHYLAMYKANDITWRHEKDGTFPSTYPIKYLKLDTKTITVHKNGKTHKKTIYPETQSFLRSQSFDTAPQANRVVMGQANGGGIMVYQYDPDKQKLKLIWAPQLKEHKGYWWQFWK